MCAQRAATALQGRRDVWRGDADAGEEAQSAGARAIVRCPEGRHFCAGLNLSYVSGQVNPRDAAAAETRIEANFSQLGFHHGFALSVPLPRIVGNQHAAFSCTAVLRSGASKGRASASNRPG